MRRHATATTQRAGRRVFKWAGLLACIILAAGWAVSIRYGIRYDSQNVEFMMYSGCMQLTTPNPLPNRGWAFHRKPFNELLLWGEVFKVTVGGRVFRSARVPLWIPFVPAAIITGLLWRRKRSLNAAGCEECGYNLTANTTGRCPECGTTITTGGESGQSQMNGECDDN